MEKNKEINKQFGLIGRQIDYSFSRGYFAEKFKKENLVGYDYKNFDLPHIEDAKPLLKQTNLAGLNVTIPYKKEIMGFLDQLSEEAKEIGAVNTLVFQKDGSVLGANTDCFGFEKALKERVEKLPERALILGTGGAAAAIEYVLKKNLIDYQFVSRNPKIGQLSYTDLHQKGFENIPLIVNTSPVGTFPNVDAAPDLPYHYLNQEHILFDLIYNPKQTKFLKYGAQIGATTINGYSMLVYQAEKAWELWNV